jgi:DNA-directed RNA polymerase alpha subunit
VRHALDLLSPPDPFASLAAPAQRALKNAHIASLKVLARKSEAEVATLHGMGPNALKWLKSALRKEGLRFKPANHQRRG